MSQSGYDIEINPMTGEFELVKRPNFSYEMIIENCCIRIPEHQQMIAHQIITVDGLMIADGTVVVLD